MTYAATIEYSPDKNKILEFRPAHREYLGTLMKQGKMVITGPFVDDSGGLLVYEADTEAQVEDMIKGDPFYKCGVFQTWVIRPWKIVHVNFDRLPKE
jgi:uncharacterized protein YciI